MRAFGPVVQSLASLTVLALLLGAGLVLLLSVPAWRGGVARGAQEVPRAFLGSAWLVASMATAGSLYLSEVAGLVPCLLCWYQRIAMYPLVLLLGVATAWNDGQVWRYGLPLSVGGFLIAAYHVTIQYRPALAVVECSATAPCTSRYLHVYGFVSIPVMAGAAFLLISGLLVGVALGNRDRPVME